jgi:hypothetical protein
MYCHLVVTITTSFGSLSLHLVSNFLFKAILFVGLFAAESDLFARIAEIYAWNLMQKEVADS